VSLREERVREGTAEQRTTSNLLEVIKIILQFAILPLIFYVHQLDLKYQDLGIKLVEIQATQANQVELLKRHETQGDRSGIRVDQNYMRAVSNERDIRKIELDLERLRDDVRFHREKSPYDSKNQRR
jgi:hypothetical protein